MITLGTDYDSCEINMSIFANILNSLTIIQSIDHSNLIKLNDNSIQIRYPNYWYLSGNNTDVGIIKSLVFSSNDWNTHLAISIFNYDNNLDDLLSEYFFQFNTKEEFFVHELNNIKVDGLNTYRVLYSFNDSQVYNYIVYIFKNKDITYYIQYWSTKSNFFQHVSFLNVVLNNISFNNSFENII